jgi:hypothetical protein
MKKIKKECGDFNVQEKMLEKSVVKYIFILNVIRYTLEKIFSKIKIGDLCAKNVG